MRIVLPTASSSGRGERVDQVRELGQEATGRSDSHMIMINTFAKMYLDNQLEAKVMFACGPRTFFCFAIFVVRAFLLVLEDVLGCNSIGPT